MNNRRFFAILLLLSFAISVCFPAGCFVFGQVGETQPSLQAANEAVNQAFETVLAAEKSGANVTVYLSRLDALADTLAQADVALKMGDTSRASSLANSVLPVAQEVMDQGRIAGQDASFSNQVVFWLSIALAIVGSVVFVYGLRFVWRRFKQNYVKSLLEMKPEVIVDET